MDRPDRDPFADAVTAFVALAWLGMLIGVSFLATPVKFQAPSLELPVALEVGSVTFAAFSTVEWGLSLGLVITTFFPRASRTTVSLSAAVVAIVTLQALWLLPALEARVAAVVAGSPLPPSAHHTIYAGLEITKAQALAAISLLALFRLGWRDRQDATAEAP
ncbi:DUF4149 domain-containing protein [Mesorhizobium sp. Z1-4]|uniref:DUF4149 domain-containing protein n=1 Tax=Mesorhizobium sp. Z1-4 TaxID=2448478 RepID=UPI000FD7F528|nr:DUF4149 domain-containing protein [Mesorhizobium sp. Z1-4]